MVASALLEDDVSADRADQGAKVEYAGDGFCASGHVGPADCVHF